MSPAEDEISCKFPGILTLPTFRILPNAIVLADILDEIKHRGEKDHLAQNPP